jgi:hypothetical protein
MKGILLGLIAAATLLFAFPAQTEARPWRYGWGPAPYRAYYRPYRPYAYRVDRPLYRPYAYEPGPGVYYRGPGVWVDVY